MDPRAGKTFELPWWQWVQFCAEQDMDPYEESEIGFDLGLGSSFTVACYYPPDDAAHLIETQHKLDKFSRKRWRRECPHNSTVALNEEGHAGIYCSGCGEKISNEC